MMYIRVLVFGKNYYLCVSDPNDMKMNLKIKLTTYSVIATALMACTASAYAQTADELLSRGREAYLDYRFEDAARLYAHAQRKAKKSDEYFADKYNRYKEQLTQARNFLDRVEKIVIIDSITVPRQDFFKAYRLPPSAGTLSDGSALGPSNDSTDYVFTNERGDYRIWAAPDTTGYSRLRESVQLTDGSWSDPSWLDEDLSENGDAIFPFMMADGVTLYYADNGENSIGGYDIMVATRDASDGTFLQPSNLGFPYNSPFDDYLLAVDELNGVGWWATDRNQLDDELTVYVFITNDLRSNYSPDEDDVTAFARIDDYIATQPEDGDYDELLATIRAIDPDAKAKAPEFTIHARGGKVYHRYDELPDAASRSAVKHYLAARADLDSAERSLSEMRRSYNKTHSSAAASKIRQAESRIEKTRSDVARMRNEVYKALEH